MESTAPSQRSSGLATYFSVLTSPAAAFTQLASTPTWGWACIIGLALVIVSLCISMPEQMKVVQIAQAHAIAQMPADQQQAAQQNIAATRPALPYFAVIGAVFFTGLIWLLTSIIFTIGAAISGGNGRFSLAWALTLNLGIISCIGAIVNAVIVALRGPDAIASPMDIYALPSLGMLVPGNVKLVAFLNAYNIFYVWLYIVGVVALERTLKMARPAAVATIVIYSLIGAGLAAAFAR